MMELLAPAGDRQALEAAVAGGADAVYLGLTTLNARRGAGNFDRQGLTDACLFCHERGVKVYVTVNTLVKDSEFAQLEAAARALWEARADAALVQDLGAARALRQMLPDLPLHASTQMAVHNRQGVRFLKAQGFSRAVLARELDYGEIRACADEGLEIEAFGHGALCVACSGQCLFSSMVGGRSGNRGMCAQPCRLAYRLEGEKIRASGDLLSPKDLCALDDLARLEQAGACSVKLEGRLKGAEYVYRVTRMYRAALDGEKADSGKLRQVFNRGYTRGYGPGVNDTELMSLPDEKHVLPEEGLWPEPTNRQHMLTGVLTARVGSPLCLTLTDGTYTCTVEGERAEKARKPADPERYVSQITRTGGTAYVIKELKTEIDPDAFAAASQLNALRRSALEEMTRLRLFRPEGEFHPLVMPEAREREESQKPLLAVEASDAGLLGKTLEWGADEAVWAPSDLTQKGLAAAPDFPFTLEIPPTLSGNSLQKLNNWAQTVPEIQGCVLNNVAHLAMTWPGRLRCGMTMNVMNRACVDFLSMPYMPSPELTAAEIRNLNGEKELLMYGRVPLMLLRHCPLNHVLKGGRHTDCRRCEGSGQKLNDCVLVDRMGARFPLSRLKTSDGCIVRIHNSVPLMLLRRLKQMPPAARWRIRLTDEDESLARAAVVCHRQAADGLPLAGEGWETLQTLSATTGHYFRGVE